MSALKIGFRTLGKFSRDKGYRVENNVVNKAKDHGLDAYRVPLSGGATIKGDVVVSNDTDSWTMEVKCRANGFKSIYEFLEGNDVLVLKADRREFLAVLPLSDFFDLLKGQHD